MAENNKPRTGWDRARPMTYDANIIPLKHGLRGCNCARNRRAVCIVCIWWNRTISRIEARHAVLIGSQQ